MIDSKKVFLKITHAITALTLIVGCRSRNLSNPKIMFNDGFENIFYSAQEGANRVVWVYKHRCTADQLKTKYIDSRSDLYERCELLVKIKYSDFEQNMNQHAPAQNHAKNILGYLNHENVHSSSQSGTLKSAMKFFHAALKPMPPDDKAEDAEAAILETNSPVNEAVAADTVALPPPDINPPSGKTPPQVKIWTTTTPPPLAPISMAKAEVLEAMNQVKAGFWGKPVNESIRQKCLDNNVPEWSDIMIHYYCQLGQPRECFSKNAQKGKRILEDYTAAYEGCLPNKDFDWVVKNQANVFRYLMYTVGSRDTFELADQDEVINQFYGVTDAATCNKRPLRKNMSNPQFPCGITIGKVTSPPALNPDSDPDKKVELSKPPLSKNPSAGESAKTLPSENEQPKPEEFGRPGLPLEGVTWYQSEKEVGNCEVVCASRGGYKANEYETDPRFCQKVTQLFLNLNVKDASPRSTFRKCDHGCAFNEEDSESFSCRTSVSAFSERLSVGWARLCPCAK